MTMTPRALALTAALLPTLAAPLAAAETTPEIQLASECVVDPEIWQGGAKIAWQDFCTGTLWTADLDPDTGEWILDGGKGKFIAAALPETTYTRNSAEWAFSQAGVELHFTQWSPQNGFESAVATDVLGRSPKVTQLTRTAKRNQTYGTPFPSKNWDDPNSRIVYYHIEGRRISLEWKEVDLSVIDEGVDPATIPGTPLPDVQEIVFKGPRWIEGERAILVTAEGDDADLGTQVFRYDIDTGAMTQLTFERRPTADGQMITLEGGQRFLLATYDQNGVIVYREDASGAFQFEKRLFMPANPTDDHSVTLWEPFEYQGRLFVVAQVAQEEGPFTPSRLKVGAGEADDPLEQFVCSDTEGVIRFDPEAFVGTHDVYVYYYDSDVHSYYRCETGLGDRYPNARR